MKTTFPTLRPMIAIMAVLLGIAPIFAARDTYDEASEKEVLKAKTIETKYDQVTADGYNYIYWIRFNAPLSKGQRPTVTIENPSLDPVTYTVEKFAGSTIRKELWCKDRHGNDISIVFRYEENPGARNSTILKVYVDKYPGKRANQQSIDAALVQSIFHMKNYNAGSVLVSSENSRLKPVKKWKAAAYTALFQWMDKNLE